MKSQKKETRKRTLASNKGGRPARPMPELISDTSENIARACGWPTEEAKRVAVRC